MSHSIYYGLDDVTDLQLRRLCEILWGWAPSNSDPATEPDVEDDRPRKRRPRLQPFFQFYKDVTRSYVPESLIPGEPHALRCHEDLFDIIGLLKRKPTVPRIQLTEEYFSRRGNGEIPLLSDQHRAFNLAVRVLIMVNCRIENQGGGLLEAGCKPCIWRSDQSLLELLASTFATGDHPSLNDRNEGSVEIKAELSAIKLKKSAGLKFQGTSELRDHLKLDQKTGVVKIYHYTSVLREHLGASVTQDQTEIDIEGGLRGNIPHQLALETLDSIQTILFPLAPGSRSFLRSLVSNESFDPDCLRFEDTNRHQGEAEVSYQYWGSRLLDLFDEAENPKARGFLETWLEQRSKARHVMMATIAGVIFAVILSILALAVGIFQAWVSYQAWKHPNT